MGYFRAEQGRHQAYDFHDDLTRQKKIMRFPPAATGLGGLMVPSDTSFKLPSRGLESNATNPPIISGLTSCRISRVKNLA